MSKKGIPILAGESIKQYIPSSATSLTVSPNISPRPPYNVLSSGLLYVSSTKLDKKSDKLTNNTSNETGGRKPDNAQGLEVLIELKTSRPSDAPYPGQELVALYKSNSNSPTHYNLLVPSIPSHTFLLPQLSFNSATKRNRPVLKFGDVLFCKVVSVSEGVAILTCDDGSRKDYLSPDTLYGVLSGGVLLPELTMADVKRMGKEGRKVEAAVGGNRAGWVKGEIYGKPKKKQKI
mmetsp:Transcript_24228/g.50537  ORF Transcript_24228/g.50537 Transcript_24228/m.50537 type:complete len:234 (+) Transcript_24228:125-826(+)|eukprot:CAMPEP_0118651170 /NCGR_PEP_ID=MMETSP0785-20121206/10644_1 /TAXON_ID=91992 /ORGANISM="Bolidomonas pacifica, Strain CCMP 1866" /LENGTH=233 /DNA_ID=CAMNT_0006543607 /DNA_START=80 /DNA_END=781 /DNA_ORIENTATION=+